MSKTQSVSIKEKTKRGSIVATIVIMTLGLIATIGVCFMYMQGYKEANIKTRIVVETLSETQLENKKLLAKIRDQKLTIEDLQKQPVDTSGDTLLERDIFIYIDKKFQIIPETAAQEIAKQIVVQSRKHGVAPELVVGIIQVESAFNPSAISKANARGLMQVMPEWAPKFGLKKVSDLHDIDTGIDCGIKVLKIHVDEEKGNLTKGLFKYVGGSDVYAGKVYTSMGQFVAYRSTIPDTEEKQE